MSAVTIMPEPGGGITDGLDGPDRHRCSAPQVGVVYQIKARTCDQDLCLDLEKRDQAARLSACTLSVASQLNSGSSRPKCP